MSRGAPADASVIRITRRRGREGAYRGGCVGCLCHERSDAPLFLLRREEGGGWLVRVGGHGPRGRTPCDSRHTSPCARRSASRAARAASAFRGVSDDGQSARSESGDGHGGTCRGQLGRRGCGRHRAARCARVEGPARKGFQGTGTSVGMGVSESTTRLHVFEDVNAAVPSPTETQTVPREECSGVSSIAPRPVVSVGVHEHHANKTTSHQ